MERRHTNRVLIIGARGVLGSLTAEAFRAAGWEVRCGARLARAGQIEIDLDQADSVRRALQEDELVVNTVPHRELLAERAVLERGGALINISALPAAAGRALRAVAAGARGTVLMNAGLAPGVTTVVAADLLRLHPDAEELEIAFTLSSATPRGPASTNFARRGLTALARHRTVDVPLPEPWGERRCLGFGEDDAAWVGGVAEGRLVRPYLCVSEPAIHARLLALNRSGGMTGLPTYLLGPRKPRADGTASHEPVAHWIAAIRGGRRLGARTVQCRGDYRHAARSAVVFANVLLASERAGGCRDPDEICTLGDVEGELRAVGISIVTHAVSAEWSAKGVPDWS